MQNQMHPAPLLSLALRTDLVFHDFAGVVLDRSDYVVVRTDAQPEYYWGNYLIMKEAARQGDFQRWLALFEKEIGSAEERGFVSLTWDKTDGELGELAPFIDAGFELQSSTVLTADSVYEPPKCNPDLLLRPLQTDQDWEDYIDIHFTPDWPHGDDDSQKQFIRKGRDVVRAMGEAGLGIRFGVELGGALIGDAGVYWAGNLARFNNVATHRNFRRLGVCSTLLYGLAKYALERNQVELLVIEADRDYYAAAIYESVGFVPTEKLNRLQWCRNANFK